MKVIPLSEAKAHLGRYARLCQKEPVVVTVNGVPLFRLTPLNDQNDNFIDRLIATNAGFRKLLQARKRERGVPIKEAVRRLEASGDVA